mmetsp:Transcript_30144/g.67555  ORF Transcript_30144/g.67555 Transcript_30144/m.67555 type:complete len:281 (-) Transcript_30144:1032-1874(-)
MMSAPSRRAMVKSTLVRPDGARIRYEIHGRRDGIPVLLLARGGMRSSAGMWSDPRGAWDPLSRLSPEKYRLVAMDQRMSNLDQRLPDDHDFGWTTFRDDQMALLDHLGIERCHILGSCIGPSYALQLLRDHPERFGGAVLLQPIGVNVHTTEPVGWEGTNRGCERGHWFGDWAAGMQGAGLGSAWALDRLHGNMFGPGRSEFVFSVTRDDVRYRIPHRLLVLCGRDVYHPAETAREIARIAGPRRAALIEEWRDVGPEKLAAAERSIDEFLSDGRGSVLA